MSKHAHARKAIATTPHRAWKMTSLLVAVMAAVTLGVTSTLRVNFTGSLPRGIYRMVSGPPSKGAVVLACMPPKVGSFARARGYVWRGGCAGGVAPVGKVVAAVGGDTVAVTVNGLVVNGHPVLNSRPLTQDRRGRPLQRLTDGVYVVPPGKMWLTSSYNPASFDSRYFGPVPATSVISRIKPLLVFGSTW